MDDNSTETEKLKSELVFENSESEIDSVIPLRKRTKDEKKRKKRRMTRGTSIRKKKFNKKKQWDLYVSKYSSKQSKNRKNKSARNCRMKSAQLRAYSFNTSIDSTESSGNMFDIEQQTSNSSPWSGVIDPSLEELESRQVFESLDAEIDSAISLRKPMKEEKNKKIKRTTRGTSIRKKRFNKKKQWDLYVSKYSSQQRKNRKKKSASNCRMKSAHLRAYSCNTSIDSTENSGNIFDFEQQTSNSSSWSGVIDSPLEELESRQVFEGLDAEIDSAIPLSNPTKEEKKRKKRRTTRGTNIRKKKFNKKKQWDSYVSKYSPQQRKNQKNMSASNCRMKSAHLRAYSFNTSIDSTESLGNIFNFEQQTSNSFPWSEVIDPSLIKLYPQLVFEGLDAEKRTKEEKKRKKRRTTRGTYIRKKRFNKKKQWDSYVSKYSSKQRKNRKNKSARNRRIKSAHLRAYSCNTSIDSTESSGNIFDFERQSSNSSPWSGVIDSSV